MLFHRTKQHWYTGLASVWGRGVVCMLTSDEHLVVHVSPGWATTTDTTSTWRPTAVRRRSGGHSRSSSTPRSPAAAMATPTSPATPPLSETTATGNETGECISWQDLRGPQLLLKKTFFFFFPPYLRFLASRVAGFGVVSSCYRPQSSCCGPHW